MRAHGWQVRWLHEDDEYDAEEVLGFLALRSADGTYECLPLTNGDTRDAREGVVWLENFLQDGVDLDYLRHPHILGRGTHIPR